MATDLVRSQRESEPGPEQRTRLDAIRARAPFSRVPRARGQDACSPDAIEEPT